MSNFEPLTGEEKEIRDSIVALSIKRDLEFFVIPDGTIEKIDTLLENLQPFLKSESKIEAVIASDYHYKLSTMRFILNLLSNGK